MKSIIDKILPLLKKYWYFLLPLPILLFVFAGKAKKGKSKVKNYTNKKRYGKVYSSR